MKDGFFTGMLLRDLITERVGYKTIGGGGGVQVKMYPYEKRGEEKVLAMLKGVWAQTILG